MMGSVPANMSTAAPAPVDEEVALTAAGLQFRPGNVTVKAGHYICFKLNTQGAVAHNFLSEGANIPYVPLLLACTPHNAHCARR